MVQEIGETREAMALAAWKLAENMADKLKTDREPFWIVFAAKPDRTKGNAINQAIKAYRHKPPAMLGILVWYVDHSKGEFKFMPELSSPPDIPIDPSLLSTRAEDALPTVMEKGKQMKVLLS